MKKYLLTALLTAIASLPAVAQVSWTATPGTAITFTGSLIRSSVPSTNLFSPTTADIYTGSAFQGANFAGTDSSNGVQFTFETASANDGSNFGFLGANFRFKVSNSSLSPVSVSAGTYHLHFDLPASAGGEITDFTIVSDPSSIASLFTATFDGVGGLDLVQTSAFALNAMDPGVSFTGNFTATAVPEPAATALVLGVALGGWIVLRRRRTR